jgi:hypothetical protein
VASSAGSQPLYAWLALLSDDKRPNGVVSARVVVGESMLFDDDDKNGVVGGSGWVTLVEHSHDATICKFCDSFSFHSMLTTTTT